MSKHTPGPWMYDHVDGVVFALQDNGERDVDVCTMPVEEAETSRECVIHADARLIAAAPELLEALRETLNVVEGETCGECGVECETCECDGSAWWRRARAAIAKAEGRS
jgi:hypothetical protein